MLDSVFGSVFSASSTATTASFDATGFAAACATSIVLGIICALIYMYKHHASKNFVVTLALLPLIVQMVISLVNGNIGAGIAVMGVFNLVRFRSIPGSAKDIGAVFLTMAVGLATGMGYLALAAIFTLIVGIANILLVESGLGNASVKHPEKSLRITIPEDLNYTTTFDDIFATYTTHHELVMAKTTNMGSLFNLEYTLALKDPSREKEFIDALRVRNANLSISLSTPLVGKETL